VTEPIKFSAHIPGNQTAVQLHGTGGMRITLDIPDIEIDKFLGKFQAMRDHELYVTIEIVPHKTYGIKR
jgi:hypothetical protein